MRTEFESGPVMLRSVMTSRREQPGVSAGGRSIFHLRGSGSSGTNWACALLNLHPLVHCSGEWCFAPILAGVERWKDQAWTLGSSERMRSVVDAHLEGMLGACLNAQADSEKPGAIWVGDRSPEAVADLGVPVILTIRDGRDVLVSMTLRYLREDAGLDGSAGRSAMVEGWDGMGAVAERFTADPDGFVAGHAGLLPDEAWVRRCAKRWANRLASDMEAIEALGERGLVVRYEAMHEDVERERGRMYEFLGLDPHEADGVSDATRTRAGFDRQDAGSFYRAGRVGDWKDWMDPRALGWFEQEAGAALRDLGYVPGGQDVQQDAHRGASLKRCAGTT